MFKISNQKGIAHVVLILGVVVFLVATFFLKPSLFNRNNLAINSSQIAKAASVARLTNSNPAVTVIEVDNTSNFNVSEVTQKFYANNPDNYDFLVLFQDFGEINNNQYHFRVRNEATGFGMPLFNDSQIYGSTNRLRGIGVLGNANLYTNGLFVQNAILEEAIAHNWGVYVGDVQDSTSTLPLQQTLAPSHWTTCLSFTKLSPTLPYWKAKYWQDNNDGTYSAIQEQNITTTPEKLDDFMLYFMGLLPADQVRSAVLLQPSAVNKSQQCNDSYYNHTPLQAIPKQITVNDFISTYGSRIPSYTDSQKDFSIAYILIIGKGTQPTPGIVDKITGWATNFIATFDYATDPKASPVSTPTPIPTFIPSAYDLSGIVFIDKNKNGIKDDGESPYSNFPVSIDPPSLPGQFPDSNGNYLFPKLKAGGYTVKLIFAPESGYTTTTPNPGSVSLNSATTVNFGLYPPQPPIISNVIVKNITGTSAEITWITSELSTSGVLYNTSSKSLKLGLNDQNRVTQHTITLTGLSKNTGYYYQVYSQNGPYLKYSSTLNFRTAR